MKVRVKMTWTVVVDVDRQAGDHDEANFLETVEYTAIDQIKDDPGTGREMEWWEAV